jgi:hypothetical protein
MSNNTFALVENHPLVGRALEFIVLAVYSNPDTGREIAKIQDPDGNVQIREYDPPHLYKNLDIDLPFPAPSDSHSDQLSFEEVVSL